jgi:hypothetical protein
MCGLVWLGHAVRSQVTKSTLCYQFWLQTVWQTFTKLCPPVLRLSFFFFHWRYNPLWVLAFSVIFFHSVLSLLNFLHSLTPIAWISSSASSIRLFLGLPLILLPIGFHSSIFTLILVWLISRGLLLDLNGYLHISPVRNQAHCNLCMYTFLLQNRI